MASRSTVSGEKFSAGARFRIGCRRDSDGAALYGPHRELKSLTISFASRNRAFSFSLFPPPQLRSGVSWKPSAIVSMVPKEALFAHRCVGRDENGFAASKSAYRRLTKLSGNCRD